MKTFKKSILYETKYHFVFCSRYRRKVLLDEVADRFTEVVKEVCNDNGWDLIFIETYPDYCHLYLECLPTDRPNDVIARIKNITSRTLRNEFEHLHHLESLWTRAYLVTTADYLTDLEIEYFLDLQKKK